MIRESKKNTLTGRDFQVPKSIYFPFYLVIYSELQWIQPKDHIFHICTLQLGVTIWVDSDQGVLCKRVGWYFWQAFVEGEEGTLPHLSSCLECACEACSYNSHYGAWGRGPRPRDGMES